MSRSNRTDSVRRRSHFTGEPHQLAYGETAKLVTGEALIPQAGTVAQQRVESAILHRLLHGARAHRQAGNGSGRSLPVKAVSPTTAGLRLVVRLGDVPAFGAALAMRRDAEVAHPPADEIVIRCQTGSELIVTSADASTAEGGVFLQCTWKDLRTSVATDPYVSAPSGQLLRFHAAGTVNLPDEARACLSGLLRRISLFTEPTALDWLCAWHDWLTSDRPGAPPPPPATLLFELSDPSYGLHPAQLRTLGIDAQPQPPGSADLLRPVYGVRPTSAQETLGRSLRRLRHLSGITLAAAAGSVHGLASGIIRVEQGRIRVKESDLERLLTLYGVTEAEERSAFRDLNTRLNEENWWQPFSHLLDDESSSRLVLQSIAEFIWEYDVRLVPNLLQTMAYAEAAIRVIDDGERVHGLLELHARRQRQALLEPTAPRIWAVLDYSAVAAGIGDPEIMRDQLKFLLMISDLRHVTLQVLMPHAPMRASARNSFAMLRLRGRYLPDVIHPNSARSPLLLSRVKDTEPYRHAMWEISTAAEEPERTREILWNELRRIEVR